MSYWSNKRRETLLTAVRIACDSVEADFAAEFQQREADRHASLLKEIDRLKEAAAKVDQLEKTNHALVQELDQLRQQKAAPQQIRDDSEEEPNWKEAYSTLAHRHVALEKRFKATRNKAAEFRESWRSWKLYAESLEVAIEKSGVKIHRSGDSDDRPAGLRCSDPVSAQTDADEALGRSSISAHRLEFSKTPESRQDVAEGSTNCRATNPPSSPPLPRSTGQPADDETQDGSDGGDELPLIPADMPSQPSRPVVIKEEPSSDTPVVVSERTVRKRKHRDDGAATPRRIKHERSSSAGPVITGEGPVFSPHESIDLDEEHGMPTPRKPRSSERQLLHDEDRLFATSDGAAADLSGAGPCLTKDQRAVPSIGVEKQSSSLPPPDLPNQKHSGTHRENEPPVQAKWTLRSGIADVAEESPGSFYSPTPRGVKREPPHSTPAHGRLHSLLNERPSIEAANILSPVHNHARSEADKENTGTTTAAKTKQFRDISAKLSPSAAASPTTSLRGYVRDRDNPPNPGRLRDRPLAQLRPEDFKVNPKANSGHKFAFDEVVRGRDERAELAGCTDPNCCGRHFRILAESEFNAGGPGILSRVADTKMMEDYLGHEAYQLVSMTSEERRKTWLKAKIQDLADRYGRHRHRFARRPTPPGYWNPDFPSTQEIEKNKEEAERREKAVVEERWREAKRGGRWLFRDE